MTDEARSPHHEDIRYITGSIFTTGLIAGGMLAITTGMTFMICTKANESSNPYVIFIIVITLLTFAAIVAIIIIFGMRRGETLMRQIMLIDESKDAQIRELLSGKDIIIEPEGIEHD